MATGVIAYCTDEDLAAFRPADWPILVPKDAPLAWGTDGVFAPGTPWVLTSASNDFTLQGVAEGNVVLFPKPLATARPPGWALAVAAVAGSSATLRPRGLAGAVGRSPAPAAGLINVEFSVPTALAQIREASEELDRKYAVNDLVLGHTHAEQWDPRELRKATMLLTLRDMYEDAARQSQGQGDNFMAKRNILATEYDELIARVSIHWIATSGTLPSPARFPRVVR